MLENIKFGRNSNNNTIICIKAKEHDVKYYITLDCDFVDDWGRHKTFISIKTYDVDFIEDNKKEFDVYSNVELYQLLEFIYGCGKLPEFWEVLIHFQSYVFEEMEKFYSLTDCKTLWDVRGREFHTLYMKYMKFVDFEK